MSFIHYLRRVFTKTKKHTVYWAHPDDETALSEVLVKYTRLGNKVQVLIATDGKDATRVTKIPAGDSLGNLRKEESDRKIKEQVKTFYFRRFIVKKGIQFDF